MRLFFCFIFPSLWKKVSRLHSDEGAFTGHRLLSQLPMHPVRLDRKEPSTLARSRLALLCYASRRIQLRRNLSSTLVYKDVMLFSGCTLPSSLEDEVAVGMERPRGMTTRHLFSSLFPLLAWIQSLFFFVCESYLDDPKLKRIESYYRFQCRSFTPEMLCSLIVSALRS